MNERPLVEGRWVVRALRMIPKLDWILLAAGIWMTLVLVATLVGEWIAPYDHAQQSIMVRNLPPGSPDGQGGTHVLGTDLLGRDLLSRIIAGARVSMVVGILGVGTAAFVGTLLWTYRWQFPFSYWRSYSFFCSGVVFSMWWGSWLC